MTSNTVKATVEPFGGNTGGRVREGDIPVERESGVFWGRREASLMVGTGAKTQTQVG